MLACPANYPGMLIESNQYLIPRLRTLACPANYPGMLTESNQ